MNAITSEFNDEFSTAVLAREVEPCTYPHANYDADGDCIEFFLKGESYYGERIDSFLTVYYERVNQEIVGCLFKGVAKFLRELKKDAPGIRVAITDGRISLDFLLSAKILFDKNDKENGTHIRKTYRLIRNVAGDVNAEAEIGDLECV